MLLPKTSDAYTVDKFRSIVMGNFLFKVITKILADYLALVASRITFDN